MLIETENYNQGEKATSLISAVGDHVTVTSGGYIRKPETEEEEKTQKNSNPNFN